MSGAHNPPRPTEPRRRGTEQKQGKSSSAAPTPVKEARHNRHGAITNTLSKWHNYKAWMAYIRSHWEEK
jgi:hypothetical protein